MAVGNAGSGVAVDQYSCGGHRRDGRNLLTVTLRHCTCSNLCKRPVGMISSSSMAIEARMSPPLTMAPKYSKEPKLLHTSPESS
ncbi:hypothetical protein BD293_3758 [Roseinatronobacter monicus]|uniref:Uncharacterized protein n=1 Tax=Roseinatronobacter monicus TaxID=393481 RepID=A0A543K5M7_9RHOB|nr:hypothetical protein BD293_3758 [Roseinatronobacter monicus]